MSSFDDRALGEVDRFVEALLQGCPEIRGVAVLLDFHKDLAQAPGVVSALVRGASQPDQLSYDELFGLLRQTSLLLRSLAERARNLTEAVEKDYAQRAHDLLTLGSEIELLRAEWTHLKEGSPAD